MTIDLVRVRAKIYTSGVLTSFNDLLAETPYITSFNVRWQRGTVSTFDASLKLACSGSSGYSGLVGNYIRIDAGTEGHLYTIFTGIIQRVSLVEENSE